MELLILLAQRKGQLVSREDIVAKLWGKDVFVDVDQSVNAAVRKIRIALKDDPATPRFLETVVGKGYRFIGEVEVATTSPDVPGATDPEPGRAPDVKSNRFRRLLLVGIAVVTLMLISLAVQYWREPYGAGQTIRSIAVLPLANLSGDSAQDYFADGISDELTTDLAKIGSLRVISRTSTLRYKGTNKALQEIARELTVDAVVEGSVVRSGSRVRITAQLIDARNDRHLWAESYERELEDILAVQSSVALEIARQVRTKVSSEELERLQRHRSVNAGAYDAYLKGRYALTTQSPNAIEEGLAAFQQAIDLDPGFAPAYAGLADTYSLLANYGVLSPGDAFPKAEAAARKALDLDPTSPEAHTAAGYPAHHYRWKWAEAEQDYGKAISLSPSYATAHLRYAELLSTEGRHDEAIAEMHTALDLDPLSLVYRSNLGRFLYYARRYDEAIQELNRTLELDPMRLYARLHLGMSYEAEGRFAEAGQALEKFAADEGGGPGPSLAHFFAVSGQPDKARQIAESLRNQSNDSQWFFTAGVYAGLNDRNQAFLCLEKAYQKRDFFLVFLKVSPYIDPLRSDPRYSGLARRIDLP